MELGHPIDFSIHLHRRFRIFHVTQRTGFDDIRRFSGETQFGDHFISLRRYHLQGKEHQGKTGGPGAYPAGNGVHLDGNELMQEFLLKKLYLCRNLDIDIWKLEQRRPWASIF